MSDIITAVAKALAYARRQVVPIRTSSSLAPDPLPVFGIALIQVVAEQRVQALAFGILDRAPEIAVSWNPLGRDAGFLEAFAEALDDYLMTCLSNGRLPRVWLPHRSALEILDLLGHRYRTNKGASPRLRRMGWQCRALAEEAAYNGQQVVAVATDLLVQHVATGQSPVEDRHLGALLAWIDPLAGIDPAAEAGRRALTPAAGML